MTVKQLWSRACKRFSSKNSNDSTPTSSADTKTESQADPKTDVKSEGEFPEDFLSKSSVAVMEKEADQTDSLKKEMLEHIVFPKDNPIEQKDKTDVLVEAFETLVDKLDNINSTFNKKIEREDKLAEILRRMPIESEKQTEALTKINGVLTDSISTGVKISENISKFNDTLVRINDSTVHQSNLMAQMKETIAESDISMKEMIDKQSKRFSWMFFASIGVCAAALVTTVVAMIMILNK